jgi:hypothetical protein
MDCALAGTGDFQDVGGLFVRCGLSFAKERFSGRGEKVNRYGAPAITNRLRRAYSAPLAARGRSEENLQPEGIAPDELAGILVCSTLGEGI